MKRHPVLHPMFFAANFVLTLAARNISQISFGFIVRPVLVIMLAALIVLGIYYALLKDWPRAGIAATLSLGIFWYYDYLAGYLRLILWVKVVWIPLLIIFGVGALLVFGLTHPRLWRRLSQPGIITDMLNLASLVVLLLPAYFIATFAISSIGIEQTLRKDLRELGEPLRYGGIDSLPDIYYIILDGYGRADVLEELYNYDVSEFMDFLTDQGFYVAEQSTSNYIQTLLSLSSSLNLHYLNDLMDDLSDVDNRWPLNELIKRSEVREVLEGQGYRIVSISSGFTETDIEDADFVFSLYADAFLNRFETFMLSLSAAPVIAETLNISIPWFGYETHRAEINYALTQLAEVPRMVQGPKFVFAHILAPHPPFVFDAAGNPVQNENVYSLADGSGFIGGADTYIAQYMGQANYTATSVKKAIAAILEHSSTPPLIILQADHGPGAFLDFRALEATCVRERLAIFNAYYMPGDGAKALYPEITPVNTFRVIFDTYWGAQMGLLEDRSYYSTWERPYVFEDVTDQVGIPCRSAR